MYRTASAGHRYFHGCDVSYCVGRRRGGGGREEGRPSLPPPLASMKNMEIVSLLSFFKSEAAEMATTPERKGEEESE